MIKDESAWHIQTIPIVDIRVVNPRQRDKDMHARITKNIGLAGLKRPITVARRLEDGAVRYDLVCGQGRLEALQSLGETTVPAAVIDVSPEDGLVMSLVENVARRHRVAGKSIREVAQLHERGITIVAISQTIGMSPHWVSAVIALLKQGESRLLVAAENGTIPMALAVQLAKMSDKEAQAALAEAYATGQLRGRALTKVQKILQYRAVKRPAFQGMPATPAPRPKVTPKDLRMIYEAEAKNQRLIVKKANLVRESLHFVVHAFRELLADQGFQDALATAGCTTMPAPLAKLLSKETVL